MRFGNGACRFNGVPVSISFVFHQNIRPKKSRRDFERQRIFVSLKVVGRGSGVGRYVCESLVTPIVRYKLDILSSFVARPTSLQQRECFSFWATRSDNLNTVSVSCVAINDFLSIKKVVTFSERAFRPIGPAIKNFCLNKVKSNLRINTDLRRQDIVPEVHV